ncbi:hypothetical protein NDU88_005258 [Pleurodeles waltl]|uniref:Uncharacterized protein n=1 Tax=Pleurodeles waltl TaxID=8319 RepID=A0AAV7SL57_PLEWA|nr:hypothetical protein NDU88_005258 [Pleurodeles waltl]
MKSSSRLPAAQPHLRLPDLEPAAFSAGSRQQDLPKPCPRLQPPACCTATPLTPRSGASRVFGLLELTPADELRISAASGLEGLYPCQIPRLQAAGNLAYLTTSRGPDSQLWNPL